MSHRFFVCVLPCCETRASFHRFLQVVGTSQGEGGYVSSHSLVMHDAMIDPINFFQKTNAKQLQVNHGLAYHAGCLGNAAASASFAAKHLCSCGERFQSNFMLDLSAP